MCAVYGPNADKPSFFEHVGRIISDYTEHRIIIGDFNVVEDPLLDRYRSDHNNARSAACIKAMKKDMYLTDVWRDRNPDTMRFSWFKRNPRLSASRIDYALISSGLAPMIENCTYLQSILTDHSAFYVSINPSGNQRGTGYWKMNSQLLTDIETVQKISENITDIVNNSVDYNPLDRWELFKHRCREMLQNIARSKASEQKVVIAQLSEYVSDMQDNMPLPEPQMNLYEQTKEELDNLMLGRAQQLIFRSKVRWVEEGEKSTKYFFNLEKSRYNAKTCSRLLLDNGDIISDDMRILEEQQRYYSTLYAHEDGICFDIPNSEQFIISKEHEQLCAEELNLSDLTKAVAELKNGKTPGMDGLPAEFYKMYWPKVGPLLVDLVQYCYDNQVLPESTRLGVLNLIPKQGKDSRLLKNLRPITLLNVDYKIIEKALAMKVDRVLPDIINNDQSGFMKNRRIAANVRKVFDIMQHCKLKNADACLINLDYIKCFDRIAFECIEGSFGYFGFPPYLQKWIKLLYQDFFLKVQNNGKFTDCIAVQRGIHQGGCLSVQIFLVCAEIIARELRSDQDIVKIVIEELEYLLNQYADDMNIASLYDQENIQRIFAQLERFRTCTGFTLSYEKTSIYRMGSLYKSNAKLITQSDVSWTNDPITILGIKVGHDEKITNINYSPVIDKVKEITSSWNNRSLSLYGKVMVINTLIASLFIYKMTVLEAIPTSIVNKFNDIINDFLWSGKNQRFH